VLVADAAVGAVHPRLEVGDRSMGARQELLAGRRSPLRPASVVVAVLGQDAVGL
jgi:hypothetical protein